MKKLLYFCLLFFPMLAFSQEIPKDLLILPIGNDEFSQTARRLEENHYDVDYLKFRESYLKSSAYKKAVTDTVQRTSLHNQLFQAMGNHDSSSVKTIAIEILSINYIDLFAHKALRQACLYQQDVACSNHEHEIEFGLLKSILKSGDGKTCSTGWKVVLIDEEYFIINMLNSSLKQQSLVTGADGNCDAMTIEGPEGESTLYFNINDVLEAENSFLSQH